MSSQYPPHPQYAPPPPPPSHKRRPPWWVFVIVGVAVLVVIGVVGSSLSGGSDSTTSTKPEKKSSQPQEKHSTPNQESQSQPQAPANPAADDVTLKSAVVTDDEYNMDYHSGDFYPKADLSFTNHSSKTSDYDVTVEFTNTNTGDRIEVTYAYVESVAPGQTVDTKGSEEDAIGTNTLDPNTPVTAKITDVIRTAS